ncbi:MAG: VCBS repeat-containing protein, partial [Bacteroidetes bacterium]|nr:VCBS repeat-containing protein [Bacteroidota bacterium]
DFLSRTHVLLVIVLNSAMLSAQTPVVDLPELQEWYSWPGALSAHISYLPNFSAQGDAITQYRKGEPTWFNRFPYDTTNQFSWKELGSVFVVSVDFNNDGIQDYMDTRGRIYTSSNKGEMPNPEPVKTLSRGSFIWASTGDFNGDGYEDIFAPNSGQDYEIIFGGKDITKIHRTISIVPNSTSLISAYVNEVGKARLITYKSSDFSEGFYLYGLTFEGTPNDSVIVNLKELDKIIVNKQIKNDPSIFLPSYSVLYQSKQYKEYTLIARKSKGGTKTYKIENDNLIFVDDYYFTPAYFTNMNGSIDGDDKEDYIYFGGKQKKDGSTQLGYLVNSGNPATDLTHPAHGFMPTGLCSDGYDFVGYVGDVNGDGVGDIGYSCNGVFTVYLGIDWQKLSVTGDLSKVDFTLHQTEPNPIGADGKAVLPATLAHSGNYTLEVYNLTGKRLGELFSGELPSGEIRLPIDVQTLNLPSGMYELRLSDGKHSREHAFVIMR